jgi:long-subunit acyl-CoA synthetase (AMP-forming)
MNVLAAEESEPGAPEGAPGAGTLCEAFQATAALDPDAIALRNADGTVELTWRTYAERVRRIAAGLAALGVGRGDTVALMMSNRVEFHLCDTAAFHLGATPFSLYNTSAPDQIAHVVGNAGSRVVIAEAEYLDRLLAARGETGEPSVIVCVDGAPDGTTSLDELERKPAPEFDFEAAWRAVGPEDVLTLIYTSGTTGPPKGVEVTHTNILAQCRAVAAVLPVRRGATITSYLPSAHIADRWAGHYNSVMFGVQVTCVPDPRQVAVVLPQLRPTIWGAVPRVVEKLKAALEAAIANDPDEARSAAMRGAIDIGIARVRLEQAGEPVPAELAAAHRQAEEQVLSKLRARLGLDRAEWVIIGAAPMSREVQEFLLGVGLPISEIYGMSECSCCVTASPPAEARVGTVGRALPGVELSLADDGELLVRGPTVTRGYRNEPEKTAEAIDSGGWLHTGDIATIDEDGHVRIVDRKKELIINAAGKNMSPANIEGELKSASPLIGQAAVIGDSRPYNVALIVLDPDAAAAYAKAHALADDSVSAVAADAGVRATIANAVMQANDQLSRVEQIKRYELLADEWLPGADELTPTMKLKRKPIAEKYADVIERLYAT